MRTLSLVILIFLGTSLFRFSNAQKTIKAFQLNVPPETDGIFEPEKWIGADSATQFVQMEPLTGNLATQKTTCYFGFNGANIYVAFLCYQTDPVVAKNQSRDALSKNDDIVAVILDTYNDNRSGYTFFVNPLGTQIEMKVNDDGINMDLNWDAEWKCAAGNYDWGWCAEMEIPFKSLKYKKGAETWGINFGRIIRSNFETVYWSGTLTQDFRISQGGKVTGIITPGSFHKISIFPYFNMIKSNKNKPDYDAGGDFQWQIGSAVSLNTTINPDFATVEADQQQINLTRYEISYPEKRLFFQEGNDMYNTRIKTFYSRRIEDIDYGARMTGKIGKTQFNLLSVKSPETPDENPATYFTAARMKVDFLESSSIGTTLVDKSWQDGFSRSLSLDYVLNLAKTWQLTGQFVGSAPGNFSDHCAGYLRFARENNIYHYHIRYTQIGSKFRETVNQTGFITDDDRREIDSDISYRWWLKNGPFKYIDLQSMNNVFWSLTGTLRSRYLTDMVNFYLRNRFNFEYAYNNEYKLYEKEFHNHLHTFSLGYNTDEWSHVMVSFSTGRNFDRDLTLLSGGGRVKMFEKLSLSYSTNLLNFNPDPENNSTWINVLTASYNFTNNLWLKLFAQNSSVNDILYFYGLFGWRFKPPFGALYLIYAHDEHRELAAFPKSNNLFLKLTFPVSILK